MTLIADAPRSYDVRLRLRIWLARARILRAAGDVLQARSLAARSFADAQVYDAPESAQLAEARAAVQ
jgi:hypothetical protein